MAQQTVGRLNIVVSASTAELSAALNTAQAKVATFGGRMSALARPFKGLSVGFNNLARDIASGSDAFTAMSGSLTDLSMKLPLVSGIALATAATFGTILANEIKAAEERIKEFAKTVEAIKKQRGELEAVGKGEIAKQFGLPQAPEGAKAFGELAGTLEGFRAQRAAALEQRTSLERGIVPGTGVKAIAANLMNALPKGLTGGGVSLEPSIAEANRSIVEFGQQIKLTEKSMRELQSGFLVAGAKSAVGLAQQAVGTVAGGFSQIAGGISGAVQSAAAPIDREAVISGIEKNTAGNDDKLGVLVDLTRESTKSLLEIHRATREAIESRERVVTIQ